VCITGVLPHWSLVGYGPTSYGEAFADVYDDWYERISDVDATVARVRELAGGGAVLELGVGTGRLALPLAESGVPVWGLDASAPMLARLRAKDPGGSVQVVRADMAAPPVRALPRFAVVFCAYNTFFNLQTEAAQLACLRSSAAALAPGGRVAIEAFVPIEGDDAPEGPVSVRSIGEDHVVLSVARRDAAEQLVTGQFVELRESGVRLRPYRIRYLYPAQLDALAATAGLTLVERWASWAGEPFGDDSPNHVSVYAAS
jgi:SAM-dependent methyltransferase